MAKGTRSRPSRRRRASSDRRRTQKRRRRRTQPPVPAGGGIGMQQDRADGGHRGLLGSVSVCVTLVSEDAVGLDGRQSGFWQRQDRPLPRAPARRTALRHFPWRAVCATVRSGFRPEQGRAMAQHLEGDEAPAAAVKRRAFTALLASPRCRSAPKGRRARRCRGSRGCRARGATRSRRFWVPSGSGSRRSGASRSRDFRLDACAGARTPTERLRCAGGGDAARRGPT